MAAKKANPAPRPQGDESQIAYLVQERHAIAEALRRSTSRAQASRALDEIFQAGEANQFGTLKALLKQPDVDTDAADVLLGMHELSPIKDIRKEARRCLIQLAGSKIYPSWLPGSEQPVAISTSYPPRFWKGQVTMMREQGEVDMILCWEQGFEYGEARMMGFLLDFWQDGIKDFYTEVGTKRHIDTHVQEQRQHVAKYTNSGLKMADCTLAEARRLVLEALDVNAWRKTTPFEDYRHLLPTIQLLLLNAPSLDEDRGYTFINPDLEADEIVANFLGGWSLGDYYLCYDLLAKDSPILEGLSRPEWVERRRNWADEATPAHYAPTVIRELEQEQSGLWLPGAYASDRAATRREVEACWSLELSDTPLSGTLPEMPLGTAVLGETGRHWFWTRYTVVKEDDTWRISRMSDEGAAAQGYSLAELEKRLRENNEAANQITRTQEPTGPDGGKYYNEILWRAIHSLHYIDALLIKNPLDLNPYEQAVDSTNAFAMRERELVYLQKWAYHIAEQSKQLKALQQIGSLQSLLASGYQDAGLPQRAERFSELAEEALNEALDIEPNALSYILLSEVKKRQQDFDGAEALLYRAAGANPPQKELAIVESGLGDIANLREQFEQGLQHFQRVLELDPEQPDAWLHVGATQRLLKQYTEAANSLQQALKQNPQDIAVLLELTQVYAHSGNFSQAIELGQQAIRLQPSNATIHALLASIYFDSGDSRRGEKALEEAERLDPQHETVKLVRKLANNARKRRN